MADLRQSETSAEKRWGHFSHADQRRLARALWLAVSEATIEEPSETWQRWAQELDDLDAVHEAMTGGPR